jgi:uncharacterized protein
MEIYLPIAGLSVHWLALLGMGASVGFLAGMFGVGGGFLLTPLLIFYGIPAEVAVATTASHLTASSMAGAVAHWRRRVIDFRMAGVMLAGGVGGSALGVQLVALLRRVGQADLVVSVGYVLLLGSIGTLMLNESLRALRLAKPDARPVAMERHHWIHALPVKMRFYTSRLYVSAIPALALGAVVGILSSVLGVGGGFILVPAMIYLLRMPPNVVVGTSLVQIVTITATTTVFQSLSNYTVDAMLALFLILGGVVGAQYGVRVAARMQGEILRLMFAILILAVGARLFYGLVITPRELYAITAGTP